MIRDGLATDAASVVWMPMMETSSSWRAFVPAVRRRRIGRRPDLSVLSVVDPGWRRVHRGDLQQDPTRHRRRLSQRADGPSVPGFAVTSHDPNRVTTAVFDPAR